jgi:hypothetical protein
LSAPRRLTRPGVGGGGPAPLASPEPARSEEITYKGYRVEPASYPVNSAAWSPRVIVSLKTDEGVSSPKIPVYAMSTARFATRDEADRQSLDVARAWIDRAVEGQSG